MAFNLSQQAKIIGGEHSRQRIWRKIVGALSCIVVFCTTYALILPAITMENVQNDLSEYLTDAQIKIDGQPYDGVSALNPGEQFTIALQWQLNRENLTDTLTYTYALPEQIKVKDVAETILYDENNNRKGVYSITDGVLTVTYDNVADLNITKFDLNATWDQEIIEQETTVKWNGKLDTHVKFDNAQIAVTKKLMETSTLSDGSMVGEYAVNVQASGSVDQITLTDTLTSDKFHFKHGYYEVDGKFYDYRYKITGTDGSVEYQYGVFPKDVQNGTVTLPKFNLQEGQTYTLEYAVELGANDRFELDKDRTATSLTNTATASYPFNGKPISSTVTVTDTYRAENKWIIKEHGDLNEDDVNQNTDVPWTVRVNPDRNYAMAGAVIGDVIQTEDVVYETDKAFTVTSITDGGSNSFNPQWIELDDKTVEAIYNARGQDTIELLYTPVGKDVLKKIEDAVGHQVSKDEISSYVFVNQSKNQFVWFAPQSETPTTYELSYITDISKSTSNTLSNSASAGWKQWTSGVVTGSFLQEVEITKENDGVYAKGDDYFVDWIITLNVPAGRNAISNAFLYDALPYHSETDGYDWLVNLSSTDLDYAKVVGGDQIAYLNDLSRSAFTITTDSSNPNVRDVVDRATASLGHPVTGLDKDDYRLYDMNDTLRGQLAIINASSDANYNNRRITPTRFGIWLGNLPDTLDKDGYTITVKYTTKVDPKLIENLDGRAYGYNFVSLQQRNKGIDTMLAVADADYWVDHSTAENVLAKSVADFDSKNGIVTYQVNINPEANLASTSDVYYILKDVLDLPGASFIENSFKLSFSGTVDPNSSSFVWDRSKETVLWRADGGEVGIVEWQSDVMKTLVVKEVNNSANGSSSFTFALLNGGGVFGLTEPDSAAGKLAPMVLTYQVKLPDNVNVSEQETITNSVTLSQKAGDNDPILLDGVKTTFDYTKALHKRLGVAPNGDNGYTAVFVIDVDKTVQEWKNTGDTFTVSDEMSKTLVVDVTSIKVYGTKSDGNTELLTSGYTAAYDDRSSEIQNFLSVTIANDNKYVKYRIEYSTKVQGEVGDTVSYDNVAAVNGTEIRSEKVEKEVYIQQQDGSVIETNYEVQLLKFDASDTSVKLQATFTLYSAYVDENNEWKWQEKLVGLKTDENGMLTLNNTLYPQLGLGPETWYKLVETDAPTGYIKGVTYFHIGQPSTAEGRPGEIVRYTAIPLDGGVHQIPNYKASLQLHKIAEGRPDSYLTGAEFSLYSSQDCSGEALSTAKEERTGIYALDLTGLTAGTTYYLKETKAPAGYELSDTIYTVTFDAEGNITLKNADQVEVSKDTGGVYLIANRYGYELPATGGIGTTLYTIAGALLLAISAGGCLLCRNKKKYGKEVHS